KTVAVKLLGNKSLKVGGREFSQTLGQRVMSTVDGEMAGGGRAVRNNSYSTNNYSETAKLYFKQERNYWSKEPVQFSGNIVYQRDDLIKPDFIDSKTGKTNLELMKMGRAPIGPDGKPINLHHMIQTQNGPIAEVTQTFHQKNSAIIHINTGNNIPSGINRVEFNKWRANYWTNRAKDFER
ncbi:hypothetical protein EGK75_13745, partial [Neisseria weixii]